jgi:hypothetical protein
MKRRPFLTLLGGAAAWPMAARAQQHERMRRIGVLLSATAEASQFQTWVGAFQQGLALLGWTIGRNVLIDTHWAGAKVDDIRRHAAELAELAPDVILAHGSSPVRALLQATRTVPIVFSTVTDPVGAGFVDSLARPGGNATGFMGREFGQTGSVWNYSRRLLQVWREWRSFGMPLKEPEPANLPLSRPWRRRLGWRLTRSPWAAPRRPSAPSRLSRALRMAD